MSKTFIDELLERTTEKFEDKIIEGKFLPSHLEQIVKQTVIAVCEKLNRDINGCSQENELANNSYLVDTKEIDGRCNFLNSQCK